MDKKKVCAYRFVGYKFVGMEMVKPAVISATLIIVFRQISWQLQPIHLGSYTFFAPHPISSSTVSAVSRR
jgi:hypothetical protein